MKIYEKCFVVYDDGDECIAMRGIVRRTFARLDTRTPGAGTMDAGV